jgi:signal transduction histidine kinase
MNRLLRFSPARLALAYFLLTVLVLALFAIPLWYAWRVNLSTFRAYVPGEAVQRFVDVFERDGASGLVAAMDSRLPLVRDDVVMVFADPSKRRLAGSLTLWPPEIPDAPGTYGLVISVGGGDTTRVVASHVTLRGGYHLLVGRESIRFESLVTSFWHGIVGAITIALMVGAVIGWMIRRALLSEVREISRTASAITEGDLTRRVPARGGSAELDTLAQTVNIMLEQLARQNFLLKDEVAVRRQAEQALHAAQSGLEGLVARRTAELAQANQWLMAQHVVTQTLAEAATLEQAVPNVLRAVCEFLKWDFGALWSIDREKDLLRCAEVWHKESVAVPQFAAMTFASTFARGVGLPGRVWDSRAPVCIPDVVHDANFVRAPIAAREGLHTAFWFPVLLGGEVLGVVEFLSREIQSPDQDLLDMMATLGSQIGQFIERKRAEDGLRLAQTELTHVARIATLGELTTSIAHEINQPLGAVVNNASACLRWLSAQNLEEARRSTALVIANGHRASEIIGRIRALAQKSPTRRDWLDLNETIHEITAIVHDDVQRHGVTLTTVLGRDLPLVLADRVQLQQVMLNLMINAIEAMSGSAEGSRDLVLRSSLGPTQGLLVSVEDSGPGLDLKNLDHLFDAFYTTKAHGLGMGLAISRSIVEAHGGRLWATANVPTGAVFRFTLPLEAGTAT